MSRDGGRAERRTASARRHVLTKNEVRAELNEVAARLERELFKTGGGSDRQTYNRWIKEIETYISQHHPSARYAWIAKTVLSDASRDLLERRPIRGAATYLPPMTFTPAASSRTHNGFLFAATLDRIDAIFRERVVEQAKGRSKDLETWAGLAFWSAISRSQLAMPAQLDALRDWLCEPGNRTSPGALARSSIRLIISPASTRGIFVGNQWADECRTALERVHHFYPDVLTLALLKRARSLLPDNRAPALEVAQCLRSALECKELPKIPALAQICQNARWLADTRPDFRISEAFLSTADGSRDNVGLDDVGHDMLFGTSYAQAFRQEEGLEPIKFPPLELIMNAGESVPPARQTFAQLSQILSRRKGKYSSTVAATAALEALCKAIEEGTRDAARGSIEHVLALWLLSLAKRSRKTVTLATYFSRIGAALHVALTEYRPRKLDPVTLYDIYESVLAHFFESSSTRMSARGCLSRFHSFAYGQGFFPQLLEEFAPGGNQFVRARALPFAKLHKVCERIKEVYPTWSEHLILATLIAYRGGLRAGEVGGLLETDIEPTQEPCLIVRPNRFSSIKSPSGRRIIPIGKLMLEHERQQLKKYTSRRSTDPAREPLFLQTVGGNHDARWISRAVTAVLKDVCGRDWTFHHLRHSAANNLLLALESDQCPATSALCEQITGWSAAQQASIRRSILADPDNAQLRYNGLAKFMGHADPAQTFRSYLHLVEVILSVKRAKACLNEDADMLAALHGKTPAWVRRLKTDRVLHDYVELGQKPTKQTSEQTARRPQPQEPVQPVQTSAQNALDFLYSYQEGRCEDSNLDKVADSRGLTLDEGRRILGAARAVASLKTAGGKFRFAKPARSSVQSGGKNAELQFNNALLLPQRHKGLERKRIQQIFANLHAAMERSPEAAATIRSATEIFIQTHYADRVALHLKEDQVKTLIEFSNLACINFERREGARRKKVRKPDQIANGDAKRRKRKPKTRFWWVLTTRRGARRGTRLLRTVGHGLAVSLLTAGEIHECTAARRARTPALTSESV